MSMETGKKYHDLLPNQSADLYGYNEALDYAMKHDSIQNIALSGSYGSGKSSVINSYEARHREKHFIHMGTVGKEVLN